MNRLIKLKIEIIFVLFIFIISLNGCSGLGDLFHGKIMRKPVVTFTGGRITKLNFTSADFLFDLNIQNPNRVGLKLEGFDYEFLINDKLFVKGDQNDQLDIKAQSEGKIQLPLSLRFVDLYKAFASLVTQDTTPFQLKCGLSFNIPVLGVVRIPVSKGGELPLMKFPKLDLKSLKIKKLNLSGAELQLSVWLYNPNAFSATLEKSIYQFEVNGAKWFSGESVNKMQVNEKGEGLFDILISLDFRQAGQSVYRALLDGKNLHYRFSGNLDLKTSMPLIGNLDFPFDITGLVGVFRE